MKYEMRVVAFIDILSFKCILDDCRDYAAGRGYDVEAVFHDDVSGGGDFMQRPGMVAMLQFMKAQAHDGYVVIFDDLKRFARGTRSST